jgi:hypothetical protein
MEGYLQTMRQTIKNYGIPCSLYADGLSTFFSSKEPTIEEQLAGKSKNKTQFGAMMDELGVLMIHARSSQAKGRIEREWGTLQGRIETEFAIRGITTVEEANVFFPEFLKIHNSRFGIKASKEESKFMPKPKHINLDRLLAMKKTRMVDNSGCFSLDNTLFQCNIKDIRPKTTVIVLVSKKLGVKVLFEDKLYTPTPIQSKDKTEIRSSSIKAIIDEVVYRHILKDERAA